MNELQAAATVLVAALLIDRLGEPPNRYHPVRWLGLYVERAETHVTGTTGGLLITLTATALFTLPALTPIHLNGILALAAAAIILKLSISGAALERAVRDAANGNLNDIRARTDLLVSRDVTDFTQGHLHSAQLETLAENTTDSLFTPLLYYAILGLPGALAYRALDTVDSMLGYREKGRLGLVPAKLEDLASILPGTLVLIPLTVAATLTEGPRAARRGLSTARRDGKARDGYNGRAMAFYAGALDVTLEKPGGYTMGTGDLPTRRDVARGISLLRATTLLTLPLILVILTLRTSILAWT